MDYYLKVARAWLTLIAIVFYALDGLFLLVAWLLWGVVSESQAAISWRMFIVAAVFSILGALVLLGEILLRKEDN